MGHVFVMRGDLQALRCDDWLMPCSAGLHVSHAWWMEDLADALRAVGAYNHRRHPRTGRRMGDRPAIPLPVPDGTPRPWLVDTTGSDPERVTARARAFVAEVAQANLPRVTRRTKRLVALPVVGTGAGGTFHEAGEVLRRLLPALREAATAHGVDVALVTWEAAQHAAAQAQRSPADFRGLPPALSQAATRLARQALQGRLVLFLGAGVSMGAGLPDWGALLTALGHQAGLTAEEMALYQQKHALDRAEYVALRLAQQGRSVGEAVCEVMGHHSHYGLAHGLLAGLPVTESVTTNYDRLFEKASAAAGRPVAVLPWQPTHRPGPWLLKMHGCLEHPDDIILTRQNYVRYAVRNAALAGI
ncbi:MAG: SIR2 family protein, partial [Myxococcales bacterium]|nr:SIR2 family protein [Myxococcales bacterium]